MNLTLCPSHTDVEQTRRLLNFIVVSCILAWKVTEFETDHYNRLKLQPFRAVQSDQVYLILASSLVGEDINGKVLQRFSLFCQCVEVL